jgi:hypothetical protein
MVIDGSGVVDVAIGNSSKPPELFINTMPNDKRILLIDLPDWLSTINWKLVLPLTLPELSEVVIGLTCSDNADIPLPPNPYTYPVYVCMDAVTPFKLLETDGVAPGTVEVVVVGVGVGVGLVSSTFTLASWSLVLFWSAAI